MSRRRNRSNSSNSWDPVADWYIGWVGARGSEHHRKLAIPAVLDLLGPLHGQRVLDIGCGTAALASRVAKGGGSYTGVDASRRLLAFARRHHADATLLYGDATRLDQVAGIHAGVFDAAVFLLSIQDIDPLEPAIASAARVLRPGGRLVILMTHPCFRIPRQSGWGWDDGRRLQYRRVDRYLTPVTVPMKSYGKGRRGATRSHHRPLERYVSALSEHGLLVDAIRELPAPGNNVDGQPARRKARRRASREIPLFLGIRAVRGENPV